MSKEIKRKKEEIKRFIDFKRIVKKHLNTLQDNDECVESISQNLQSHLDDFVDKEFMNIDFEEEEMIEKGTEMLKEMTENNSL